MNEEPANGRLSQTQSISFESETKENSDANLEPKTSDSPLPPRQSSVKEKPVEDEKIEVESPLGEGASSIQRIVIATWKIRQSSLLIKALKPGVEFFQYKADATFSSILSSVNNILKGKRIVSIAYLCHGNPGTLVFCNEKGLATNNIEQDNEIKLFLYELIDHSLDQSSPNIHLDFLASPLLMSNDGQSVLQSLKDYLKIPITVSKDILGNDRKRYEGNHANVGELYFNTNLLRSWSGTGTQSISNYEKIRTLGRGAYGTAVLYRKKDDDSLVVLKEISMLDLSANQRQSAMNEVKVLGMLSHPNIVSYYDSFDEDGTLWIEMEYADGGTLTDYLAKQENDIEEREILIMFSQMVSAIKYCHDHSILHRDLKTQNIFLTQEGKVKLGDFGIAKIMTTNAGNFSVVGTPYYISPEMCEGKPYDHKSDIWALGCILYEMANLVKTFDGTNLPALITKIVKGTFAPIKDTYTPEFRSLVRDLLQKEPAERPLAQEILFNRLPELLQRYDDHDVESGDPIISHVRTRSILYYCDVSTMQLHQIRDLPVKIQIIEVAVGLGHIVVVSQERGVFTWGDNSYGQLGHGDFKSRAHATEVVLLRGKSIIRATCGDYFTAFLSDNGLVLTCGQGDFGCLGHGDWNTLSRPKLIDELLTLDIVSLNTGSHHLAVTTGEGDVYTWGCGFDGRLGHGHEQHLNVPTKINFPDGSVFIRDVRCSDDGTVYIADTGTVFACGRNTGNKLGLNPRQGFLLQFRARSSKNTIESAKVPTLIKDLCRYQIQEIQFGNTHSCFINGNRMAYTNGNNADAQLGCGNTKPREAITIVKGFEDQPVAMIACGSTFTFAGIVETFGSKKAVNSVYFWGTKPPYKKSRNFSASDSYTSRKHSTVLDEDSISSDGEVLSSRNSGDNPTSSRNSSGKSNGLRRSTTSESGGKTHRSIFDEYNYSEEDEVVRSNLRNICRGANLHTLNLVAKENTPVIIPHVEFKFETVGGVDGYDEEYPVVLQDIKSGHDHVIIHLETIAPPPKKRKTEEKSLNSSISSVASNTKEESSETSELDTSGEVPTWIRNELESGIHVQGNTSKPQPVYIDHEEQSDEDVLPLQKVPIPILPIGIHRTRSFDTISRRSSSTPVVRDPNFSLVPKLKKQGTLLKIKESASSANSETRIVDGVSYTTSIAKIETAQDTLSSSAAFLKETDLNNNFSPRRKKKSSEPLVTIPPGSVEIDEEVERPQPVDRKDSGKVDYIPIQSTASPELTSTPRMKRSAPPPKPGKPPQHSKARSKRNQVRDKTENTYRTPKNIKTTGKDKGRTPSSTNDMDDLNDNNQMENLDEIKRQAEQTERSLKEEIKKLQFEKEQQEEALKRLHDVQLKEREEKSAKERQEARNREESLKNEILNLKTDLNNQNSKLQDNYNILLSLQEQLLSMQQSQLRGQQPQKQMTTQQLTEAIKDHKTNQKSSVCSLM